MGVLMSDSYSSANAGESKAQSTVEGLFSESISFLVQLRAKGPWVLTAILPDGGAPTITRTVHTAHEVEAFLHEHNGKRNIYYSTNPTKTEMSKKAAKADIAAIEYSLADLDPADGEASEAAKARYLAQLETFEPKPTATVDSGNGIQCLWRLTNAIVLPEEEAVRKAIIEDVDGGVGKTALRNAQYISLATGRNLTGEHIFQRCRVLIVSLEDDLDELRRRIWALRLHYKIPCEELKGWLFLWAPGVHGGKLMELDKRGNPVVGKLRDKLKALITHYKADFVGIDPFVKTHGVGENNNVAIDMVVQVLVDLCHEMNIGADVPHHVSKAQKNDSEPGDANRGRGASAMKDAARLVYTLNVMTKDEAEKFGIKDEDRWAYVRMDKGKVNIVPPSRQAKWFHLIGVPIGNVSEMYPHGDEVQAVEPWDPPDVMGGMSDAEMGNILNKIEKGFPDGSRYTNSPSAKTRAAWKVVVEVIPEKNEQQAREIIKTWISKKILEHRTYQNPKSYKEEEGLWRSDVEIPF